MLNQDAAVPATVILDHLRKDGYDGGITILKEHVATLRPAFLAARSFQRTTYLPGEFAHGDWWEPEKTQVPVGNGATRKPYGWVTTLPHSAAHATVFSFGKTMADLLQAVLGCLTRLGGVPDAMVVDNDSSIVASRVGKKRDLAPGGLGALRAPRDAAHRARPGKARVQGSGRADQRLPGDLVLPLRDFCDLDDLQSQHDSWTSDVAFRRHHRRVGGAMADDLRSIEDEARRLEESVTQSAQNQFEQAKLWRGINLLFGVPAAALAAVAGGTGLAGVAGRVPAAIMALISAGLAGALTTLNAGRRVTQAHSSANAYLAIQTDLRQFRTIDLAQLTFEDARQRLAELTARMEEVNKTADVPSRLAHYLARRNLEKGQQTYEVDRETK